MEEERTVTRSRSRPAPDGESNTLLNALVGAAATVLTAPLLPFAAVFGGGVAGYLQRRDLAAGATVGAAAGALASIPAFLVGAGALGAHLRQEL